MKERIRGYVEAMNSYNLSDNICVIEVGSSRDKSEISNACFNLFVKGKNIDAVIFSTNLLSIEGLYCVSENKIRIPEDMGFIGFDGGDCFDLFYCPITYIKQPIEEMAVEAVKTLMDYFVNIESPKISHIILESKLIIRSSSR
jgi:LacI family transcriptional regulator